MEANFIACGQGYSPASVDQKGVKTSENFNSIRQIDEVAFVTMASYDKALHNWNIQAHNWLKYYVMLRLMDRSKPRGQPQIIPTIVTFLISAAWHGLATGMFVAFFMCSLLD